MYTVLIVEDEMLVSVGLKNMICWSDLDMTIIGRAQNGLQGLEMYHQKKPDIILTDIKMPVMDGLEMIAEIRKEDSATKIIVLSSYEDYELVRQAFILGISDYIIKLKMMPENMERLMLKVRNELLEESALEKKAVEDYGNLIQSVQEKAGAYITGQSCSYDEFKILSEKLQISEEGLSVCVIEIFPSVSKWGTEEKQHHEMVLTAIRDMIENLLSECQSGVILPEKENRYLILFSFRDIPDQRERECLKEELISRIQSVVQYYMNKNTVLGVSRFGESYRELNRLYKEAVKALDEAWFLEEEMVCYGDPRVHQEFESILEAFESRMPEIQELENGYQVKLLRELAILKKGQVPERHIMRDIVIRWVHWASYKGQTGQEEQMQLALDAAERIHGAVSMEDMLHAFELYLMETDQDMEETKTLNRELANAVSYIKQHYCEPDISLPKVANEVMIHKDYLSKLFRRELGIGFSDYVNSQRIRKAQKLLKNTHMRSYEISRAVGFQDESYFSRVFKKVAGVRPNEYKRQKMTELDLVDEEYEGYEG